MAEQRGVHRNGIIPRHRAKRDRHLLSGPFLKNPSPQPRGQTKMGRFSGTETYWGVVIGMALSLSRKGATPATATHRGTGLLFRAETDQNRPPKRTTSQAELDHLHQIRHREVNCRYVPERSARCRVNWAASHQKQSSGGPRPRSRVRTMKNAPELTNRCQFWSVLALGSEENATLKDSWPSR